MFTNFFAPEALPFAVSLAVVVGLFILELLSALVGGTILGFGSDGPDIDIDADADFDLSADAATDFDLDVSEAGDTGPGDAAPSGALTWLGIRNVPFLIWFVSFLTVFGLAGLMIQSASTSTFGAPLPALIASLIAAVPALAITKVIANWVAKLMPKTETSAMRARFLGGHHGTITQGTAARGKPAEVKIKDRHGNIHYLRVEPLMDDETFEQGSEVTLIRKRGDKFFVI